MDLIMTLQRETYAAAYSGPTSPDVTPSVDLLDQDVERDGEGHELARTEAGSDTIDATDWGTEAAEAALIERGWRPSGEWEYSGDLGGVPGWTVLVTR